MCEKGRGGEKDLKRAFIWYEKGAQLGHVKSLQKVGEMYLFGRGVTKDYEKAYRWLEKGAKKGDPSCQFHLGVIYDNGWGRKRDFKKAVRWWKKSAHQGLGLSQYLLGMYYLLNEKNRRKARVWLDKARKSGDRRIDRRAQQAWRRYRLGQN